MLACVGLSDKPLLRLPVLSPSTYIHSLSPVPRRFFSSHRYGRRRRLCSVSLVSPRRATPSLRDVHAERPTFVARYVPLGLAFASPLHAPGPSGLKRARLLLWVTASSAFSPLGLPSESTDPADPSVVIMRSSVDMEIKSIPLFRGLHREIGSYFICAIKTRAMTTTVPPSAGIPEGIHALIYWSPIRRSSVSFLLFV